MKYRVPFKAKRKIENNGLFLSLLTREFYLSKNKLEVVLGLDENRKPVYFDLSDQLLMSGVTCSGKSICIHTIICSLLLKNSPEDLKLVLIDPKGTELSDYCELPHLAMPILTPTNQIFAGLKWANEEIERRYRLFQKHGVSNLEEYEKLNLDKLPALVIVADEYVDILGYGQEAVDVLVRISQTGKPAGVYIVLSTTKPTPNVITEALKASFNNRISLKQVSDTFSKGAIDKEGAEDLKGKGDMILKLGSTYIHLQGAYIEDSDIEVICDCIKKQYPLHYIVSKDELEKTDIKPVNELELDKELLYEVSKYAIKLGFVSTTQIQSQFGLGFNSAMRILYELEDKKILSPKQGTKGRQALVNVEELNEILKK